MIFLATLIMIMARVVMLPQFEKVFFRGLCLCLCRFRGPCHELCCRSDLRSGLTAVSANPDGAGGSHWRRQNLAPRPFDFCMMSSTSAPPNRNNLHKYVIPCLVQAKSPTKHPFIYEASMSPQTKKNYQKKFSSNFRARDECPGGSLVIIVFVIACVLCHHHLNNTVSKSTSRVWEIEASNRSGAREFTGENILGHDFLVG